MDGAEAAPFKWGKISYWVADLNFINLAAGDTDARNIVQYLTEGESGKPHILFGGNDHRWQLILRCSCALDFCQGHVEKRQTFDWSQPPQKVYEWLLIEFWRQGALHWAHKRFGYASKILAKRDSWKQKLGGDPTHN
jgi:glutathione S-transferase